jgi:hypothetical protein
MHAASNIKSRAAVRPRETRAAPTPPDFAVALSVDAFPAPHGACPVAGIAHQFRRAVDKYDATDASDCGIHKKRDLLANLDARQHALEDLAGFERASSVEGALFQLALASSIASNALHHPAWSKDGNPHEMPTAVTLKEQALYRLLFSASRAIAQIHGIPATEYAGDYFLGVDPFEELEGSPPSGRS